jgi:hypothetical protein
MQETVINAQTILEAAKRAKQFSRTKEQIEAARRTLEWMEYAKSRLTEAQASKGAFNYLTDLTSEPEEYKKFLFDTLEAGEIRIVIDGGRVRIEETGVPTVWRMLIGNQDLIAISLLPQMVTEAAATGESDIVPPAEQPEGLFAAPSIITELRAALAATDLSKPDPDALPLSVELSRQPLSPQDKTYISEILGSGRVEVNMRGFARSTIEQTRVRGVWRSRILSNANKELLDQVVVCTVPPEVMSSREDIPDALKRLQSKIDWCRSDLDRAEQEQK